MTVKNFPAAAFMQQRLQSLVAGNEGIAPSPSTYLGDAISPGIAVVRRSQGVLSLRVRVPEGEDGTVVSISSFLLLRIQDVITAPHRQQPNRPYAACLRGLQLSGLLFLPSIRKYFLHAHEEGRRRMEGQHEVLQHDLALGEGPGQGSGQLEHGGGVQQRAHEAAYGLRNAIRGHPERPVIMPEKIVLRIHHEGHFFPLSKSSLIQPGEEGPAAIPHDVEEPFASPTTAGGGHDLAVWTEAGREPAADCHEAAVTEAQALEEPDLMGASLPPRTTQRQ